MRKPTELIANHRAVLKHFENSRCSCKHAHTRACNSEVGKAARYTPNMHLQIVDAVKIARDLFAACRCAFADRKQTSTFVTHSADYDLDGPTMPREANGLIRRPRLSGLGRPACADNAQLNSPRRIRHPRQCRRFDTEP
eukprot:4811188-Pyramimonas_sp.AAC.1